MSSSSDARETVGRFVFGAAALGMRYGLRRVDSSTNTAQTEDEAAALVERALAAGITTFDTAPAYGASEERLGRALAGRGAVWTKVTAGDPAASLDASLVRLQRSRVELLQWHNWTAALADDAAWRDAWSRLRSDRRVERLGATTYGVADALAAVESGHFDVVQVEFHLLNQGVVEALAEHAARNRIRIAVRSVLLQGALTTEGRELPDLRALRVGVARAREVAGDDLTRLALRTALEHRAISHVLVGFDRKEQIDEALRIASGAPLAPEQSARVRALDLRGEPECDPRTWPD